MIKPGVISMAALAGMWALAHSAPAEAFGRGGAVSGGPALGVGHGGMGHIGAGHGFGRAFGTGISPALGAGFGFGTGFRGAFGNRFNFGRRFRNGFGQFGLGWGWGWGYPGYAFYPFDYGDYAYANTTAAPDMTDYGVGLYDYGSGSYANGQYNRAGAGGGPKHIHNPYYSESSRSRVDSEPFCKVGRIIRIGWDPRSQKASRACVSP